MFGGKDIVMAKLRKRASTEWSTPRQVLSDLYSTRNLTQVGKVLGVTQRAITNAMNKLKINRRAKRTATPKGVVASQLTRRGRTTNQTARQLFVSYYSTQGKSLQEIADILNVSVRSVHNFATKHGISLRRVGRPSGKTKRSRSILDLSCF